MPGDERWQRTCYPLLRSDYDAPLLHLASAIAVGILALTLPSPAKGALLVYEGFNYTPGDLETRNGGDGWEDAGWNLSTNSGQNTTSADVVVGSLGYGSLQTSGNSASLANAGGNTQIFRDFGSALGDPAGSIWISFVISATANNIGAGLFLGSTEQIFLGSTANSTPVAGQYAALYTAGVNRPIINGGSVGPSLGVFPITGLHLMVMQFDLTGSLPVFRAWLDPNQSSLGLGAAPTGGTTTTVNSNTQSFTSTSFRLGEFSTGALDIDEIRIGQTWVDVSPVPETSAVVMLLGGLGMLGLLRRRRACANVRTRNPSSPILSF